MQQAVNSISAMKCHFLRAAAQDECGRDITNSLGSHAGLLVIDRAMKYLPRLYRETQSDCFGRRGMSCHISVLFTKVDGHIKTFVHVFQSCPQDAVSVAGIIAHIKGELDRHGTTEEDLRYIMQQAVNSISAMK